MNKCVRIFAPLIHSLSCGALLLSGCTQMSGTEVGNPSFVSGKVSDDHGNTVANADVFLVLPDYIPLLDSGRTGSVVGGQKINAGETQRISTRTNSKGEFILNEVTPGIYNLFAADSFSRHICFMPRIAVNKTHTALGVCTIRRVGYAAITVADSIFKPYGCLSLPGTPVKKTVDSAGRYTLPILSDSLNVTYFSKSGDTLAVIIDNRPVSGIQPGDTLDLTGFEPILVPPSVAALIGNDTLFSMITSGIGPHDTIIRIIALGATINDNSALEYQFYEAMQKKLSAWSDGTIYLLWIKPSSNYSVSCRVRSKSKTSLVTAWTPGLIIKTPKLPDTLFVTAPNVPVPLDSFPYLDTLFYRFKIGGSISSDSLPADYRLGWSRSDTTNLNGMSPWKRDSIFSVRFPMPGTYTIRAQARNAIDSSCVSSWSDTLFFTVRP